VSERNRDKASAPSELSLTIPTARWPPRCPFPPVYWSSGRTVPPLRLQQELPQVEGVSPGDPFLALLAPFAAAAQARVEGVRR